MTRSSKTGHQGTRRLRKILVANRGEIAIRVLRAANELGKRTATIYAEEDKLSLHRFKADEAYRIGEGLGPVKAYLDIDGILDICHRIGADGIHPGYGFLSENPDFAQACRERKITFIGPDAGVMRTLGDKVAARSLARAAGVPVLPASDELPEDISKVAAIAEDIGYPVMLKASWGGGGRGMRVISNANELEQHVLSGRREAKAAFGNDSLYMEKLISRAHHVEVQILGDHHGRLVHLFERDCSIQRRNQKIVECAPAPYLQKQQREHICDLALKLMGHVGYQGAGTVEFLQDIDENAFYFIEVNPRIQVEHTVTEEITGIDLVKAQIRIAEGAHIGNTDESGVPEQGSIDINGHAMQCRITAEDPLDNFIPDYGRITAYRGATGFGIRLDGGTAYSGALITRYYDSLLEKVTAWAPNRDETIARMTRALREFRIRGVATNLTFLENLITRPEFANGEYTTRFVDEHSDLFSFHARRDRASRLLNYIAEVTINEHADVTGRPRPNPNAPAVATRLRIDESIRKSRQAPAFEGAKAILDKDGAKAVADWMLSQERTLITDTTMRDAHQSLLATRMRSFDMERIADAYDALLPELFSIECWGGATFDVALRFLKECPWERLQLLRQKMPNHLLQMLLRAANGVGYTNYPDNVVRAFTLQAAQSGIDLFRVFDSLNWVENMRVAIDAVLESGKICEAAICYTGDMLDKERSKYNLDFYVKMARELSGAGAHIIGIKDMAGLLKPAAASVLVRALKEETGLPIHFHTHDTSGIAASTVMSALDAGADAVDGAMDSFSGMTSQPNLGSIVEALRHTPRDSALNPDHIRSISEYWEQTRNFYAAFESDMRAGASEVYLHEMPGGQFTNLKEQARALGLADRWHEVARAYAEVNLMFGDIVKVTPSSKVVGDMALAMVSAGWSREDVEDLDKEIFFPDSVIGFFRGDLGQPPGGFPEDLQKKILQGKEPLRERPGASLPETDLEAVRAEAEKKVARSITHEELQSYLMYPRLFVEYAEHRRKFGPVSILPTLTFFYGMQPGEEISIDLEAGKSLVIRCQAIGETDDNGMKRVFFELNGQPRVARIADKSSQGKSTSRPRAESNNPNHIAAPMPGMITSIAVNAGRKVHHGDILLSIEAMKMETVLHAERDGVIERLHVAPGEQVDAKDLLLEYSPQ